MTNRKKTTAGFWITAALVAVLFGYPLSSGPACWLTMRLNLPSEVIDVGYHPIVSSFERVPREIRDFAIWYSEVGGNGESVWYCDTSESSFSFRGYARWRR